MTQYPLLQFYRRLSLGFAIFFFIIGVINALRVANGAYSGFDLVLCGVTFFPYVVAAFSLAVAAQMILLFLNMHEKLEHVTYMLEQLTRQNTTTTVAPSTINAPRSPMPTVETSVRVRASQSALAPMFVRVKPDSTAETVGQLQPGQTMTVYGRNAEGTWFALGQVGRAWINAAEVEVIEGSINRLPVTPIVN